MPSIDNVSIVPPTAAEQARLGWKMQRRIAATERAEQARLAEAVATGRKIRGGTYTVAIPPEYSQNPENAPDDVRYVELPHSGKLAELVTVELPGNTYADPRNVWNPAHLVNAANAAARKAARRTRGATETDAQDAAAEVIADILRRTRQGMPLRSDVTPDTLSGAARHKLADLIAQRAAETPDAGSAEDGAATDPAELAEAADAAEMRRAQRDADPMLNTWAEPFGREVAAIIDAIGATEAERVALMADAYGLRAPDIATATGKRPSTVRVTLHRGRAALAKRSARETRDAAAAATVTLKQWQADAERRHALAQDALRFIGGDAERPARSIAPMPERMPARTPDAATDHLTVGHAPVRVRRLADID